MLSSSYHCFFFFSSYLSVCASFSLFLHVLWHSFSAYFSLTSECMSFSSYTFSAFSFYCFSLLLLLLKLYCFPSSPASFLQVGSWLFSPLLLAPGVSGMTDWIFDASKKFLPTSILLWCRSVLVFLPPSRPTNLWPWWYCGRPWYWRSQLFQSYQKSLTSVEKKKLRICYWIKNP